MTTIHEGPTPHVPIPVNSIIVCKFCGMNLFKTVREVRSRDVISPRAFKTMGKAVGSALDMACPGCYMGISSHENRLSYIPETERVGFFCMDDT